MRGHAHDEHDAQRFCGKRETITLYISFILVEHGVAEQAKWGFLGFI